MLTPPLSSLTDLSGKTALVTGGARGIGLAIAQRLGEAGANLVIADIDGEAADLAVQQLKSAGAVRADVSQEADVLRMAEQSVRAFGSIDILMAAHSFAEGESPVTVIRTFDPARPARPDRRLDRSAPPADPQNALGRPNRLVTSTDHQSGGVLPAAPGDRDPVPNWVPEPDVRVLDRAECLELLATAPIGQLVFTYQAMPDILPVNVAVADDVLLIPFTDGSLIERAARNTVVAFHADRIDEVSHLGWSVTVVGRSFELRDGDALAGRPVARPRSWMPGRHDRTLAVALERVTGRRLVPAVK